MATFRALSFNFISEAKPGSRTKMINDNRRQQLSKRQRILLPLLLLLASASAQAQMSRINEVKDFNQRVSGNYKTTYIELIRKIFPDAKFEGRGFQAGESIPMRSLEPRIGTRTFERGKLIGQVFQMRFLSENKNHLALFFKLRNESPVRSLNNSFFVLAAFRLEKEPEFVEAVDAQFIFQHQNINLWAQMPLIPIRKGDEGIWLVASRQGSSGNEIQDFRLVALRDKKFEIVLDNLPTLKGNSGCGFQSKQSLSVFLKKDNSANYRNFSLNVSEKLRTNTIKCPSKPPADYDKTFAYLAVWDDNERRYKVAFSKAEAVAVAPDKNSADLSEPVEFAGRMEVGKIYRAEIGCRGNPEWQLKIDVEAPENAPAIVFWSGSGLSLPRAKFLTEEQCNANILFKVLKETSERRGGRLRTHYECEIKAINKPKFNGSNRIENN